MNGSKLLTSKQATGHKVGLLKTMQAKVKPTLVSFAFLASLQHFDFQARYATVSEQRERADNTRKVLQESGGHPGRGCFRDLR